MKKPQILIVDDYPTNIKVLSDLLMDYGFEVLIAKDGDNALQKLQRITPDIILLDVLMPGVDGFETCRRLKEQESTCDIPVIFMTALSDPVDKIKGLTLGAVDYITKPFQQEEVLARVNAHLKLRYLTKQLEEQNAQLQEQMRSRQLAESALRNSEEKFAKAFRSNPGPMMILTLAEGRFLDINQNFCTTLGYPPEMVLGKTFDSLNLCSHEDERNCFFNSLRKTGMVQNHECQFYTQSGETKFFLISAEVIHVQELPCILAMMIDITECKQTAIALKQAKEFADIANQAKSHFLANISHELRTPLNTILGYTQLMSRGTLLSPEQQEYLNIINRGGEHLLTLINDVLEITKIEAGQTTLYITSFDLYALLQTLSEMLHPKAAAKALQFTVERDPDIPQYICADETKLRQVLINLVGNGIKFTQTGSVSLRVRRAMGQPCDSSDTACTLHFEIADTGPGIASDETDQLFDPFIQTETGRRSQEGTGLGLPISLRLVQLMGGDIAVTSTVGVGSVFSFEIPVALATASQCETLTPERRIVSLASGQPTYRILVVDDQIANRQLLAKLLTLVGFEVREAENGAAAIAQYQSWSPHLIWMDVRMPVMDGYEATRRIKHLQAEANLNPLSANQVAVMTPAKPIPKIIALTANAFEEERMAALAAGYDDFVRKPIQETNLLEKIAEHLGVRYIYSDAPLRSAAQSIDYITTESVPSASAPYDEDRNVLLVETTDRGAVSNPTVSPPALEIDESVRASLWELARDDHQFLSDYFNFHLEDLPKQMQALREAIANQDARALVLAAHSLKSMSLTFKAEQLVEFCQLIEWTARTGITTVSATRLSQLETELNRLVNALKVEQAKIQMD